MVSFIFTTPDLLDGSKVIFLSSGPPWLCVLSSIALGAGLFRGAEMAYELFSVWGRFSPKWELPDGHGNSGTFSSLFVCCKNSQGELPYSSEQELTEVFCISWKVNWFVCKSIYLNLEFGGPFCCLAMLPVPSMWLHLLLPWIVVDSWMSLIQNPARQCRACHAVGLQLCWPVNLIHISGVLH